MMIANYCPFQTPLYPVLIKNGYIGQLLSLFSALLLPRFGHPRLFLNPYPDWHRQFLLIFVGVLFDVDAASIFCDIIGCHSTKLLIVCPKLCPITPLLTLKAKINRNDIIF